MKIFRRRIPAYISIFIVIVIGLAVWLVINNQYKNLMSESDGAHSLFHSKINADTIMDQPSGMYQGSPFGGFVIPEVSCLSGLTGCNAFQAAYNNGISRVRAESPYSADWCNIEKPANPGVYNFDSADADSFPVESFITKAEQKGPDILLMVKPGRRDLTENPNTQDTDCDWVKPDIYKPSCLMVGAAESAPPKDYQKWYDFAYNVALHYGSRVKYYQTQSESDNCLYWTGRRDEFFNVAGTTATFCLDRYPKNNCQGAEDISNYPAAVLPVFYRAIHDANSQAIVLGGGLTYWSFLDTNNNFIIGPFADALFKNKEYYDEVDYHYGILDNNNDYFDKFRNIFDYFGNLMISYGVAKPIALTEQIYQERSGDWCTDSGLFQKCQSCNSETLQRYSESLFKQVIYSFSKLDVSSRVVWFSLFSFNSGTVSFCVGVVVLGVGAGTLAYNLSGTPTFIRHPAGDTWAFLSGEFGNLENFQFLIKQTVGSAELYEYRRSDGKYFVGAWCNGTGCSQTVDLSGLFGIPQGTAVRVLAHTYKSGDSSLATLQGANYNYTISERAPVVAEWTPSSIDTIPPSAPTSLLVS